MSAPLPPLLAVLGDGGRRQWNLSYEGLSPGWAFLLFLLLAAATLAAYWKLAPGVPLWRRGGLALLRLLAAAVLVGLLAKPVLNLTLHEPVRQPLAVLVDASQSMGIADRRKTPDDLKRAVLAAGAIASDEGLKPALPAKAAEQFGALSRHDLLRRVAGNAGLNLWPRLAAQADLQFYQFGRNAAALSSPVPAEGAFKPAAAEQFFAGLKTDEPQTALGEALRHVLQEPRPQALGGVLLITDGASNSGSSPLEAAQIAREQNVPLFIYGVGVTSPRDVMVREVTAQKLAFVGERMEVRARMATRSLKEQKAVVTLRANGEPVDEQEVTLGGDREQELIFHVSPQQAGVLKVEVSVPVLGEEASQENNVAATTVRVTDSKFHVLLIEQEPRWDFRYLLDYLQRDPRLEVQCVMINGEPGLENIPNSPFLPALPDSREAFFKAQVLILGDVNPEDLGEERMRTIAEWVEAGGGLILLAGPNFNPRAYAGTPLEPLLPVVPDLLTSREVAAQRTPEPFQLQLTRQGENSPYLQMDPDPEANQRIWEEFPGVRWTATLARVKPGAEVLLVDPRPERMGRYGMLPVFAMQGYGSGKCVYFGTNETYRWRSRTGEKYYSILWGQIMQTLALQLLEGASSLTQLKTDRKEYAVGDRVVIAGNAYTEGYAPLIVPTLEGLLKIEPKGEGAKPMEQPLSLHATERNAFRGEFIASAAGSYTFATLRDPEGVLKFEVVNAQLEQTQTALEEKLLKAMAETAGGHFLREEGLAGLPKLIAARSATVAIFKKVELFYSGWSLMALLGLLFLEWLFRRLNRLK
ncbi:MAG: hypothetical protein QOE70_5707 [Chthoniobacter sp.]|jgi:hypothetical protein|nr:hypothetical protein [Chthoniobacter sp.]